MTQKTYKEKAIEIKDFVLNIQKLEHNRNDENITLCGLNGQKESQSFTLRPDAGSDFVAKYDLVPGTDLYDGYIKKLGETNFNEMTTEQKQMVMMILCAAIFYGDYEYFSAKMPELSKKQKVALDLVAEDVTKIKENIVPVLNRIEKNGCDADLEKKVHNTFDIYAPQKGWGPRKGYYSEYVCNTQCNKWAEDPEKNEAKIKGHKDYMVISLLPNNRPSMFRLLNSVVGTAMKAEWVNNYFVDFRSVNNIRVLLSDLRDRWWDDRFLMLPAIQPWIQSMRSGVEQSIAESEEKIKKLDSDIADWKQKIGAMYTVLNANGKESGK